MTKPHIPSLDAIRALPSLEFRLYAIIGAVVSLSAGLEVAYVDIFAKGLNIPHDQAARILFHARNSSLQRGMACAALRYRLGSGSLVPEWQAIADQIANATRHEGLRNLIAHNVVSAQRTYPIPVPPYIFFVYQEDFVVHQNQQKVIAGVEKAKTADFDSLLALCEEFIDLLNKIDEFLAKLP